MPTTTNQFAPKRPRGRPRIADIHPVAPNAKYLTTAEVAAELRVSDDTVRRLLLGTLDSPPLISSVLVSGSRRIPREALERYLAANTTEAGVAKVSDSSRRKLGMR